MAGPTGGERNISRKERLPRCSGTRLFQIGQIDVTGLCQGLNALPLFTRLLSTGLLHVLVGLALGDLFD